MMLGFAARHLTAGLLAVLNATVPVTPQPVRPGEVRGPA
jgi:hypothetical protein